MPEIKQDIRAATFIVAANDSVHKNMADYVCDGVNDHIEIQAALDALPATGGEVKLLDGTYNCQVQIDLDTNQTLRGCGRNTILTTSTAHLIFLSAVGGSGTEKTGITVTDLQIDGGADGVSDIGIYFKYVDYSTIQNVYSRRHRDGSTKSGIYLYYSDFNTLSGNTSQGNDLDGINLQNSNKNIVSGNIGQGNDSDDIILHTSHNNTVQGNTCETNSGNGVSLMFSDNNSINGNTCLKSYTGIYVDDSDNNSINGNTCSQNGYGIYVEAVSKFNTITGNTLQMSDYEGMFLSEVFYNTIQGNTLVGSSQDTNNSSDEMYLTSCDYNNIQGNTFRSPAIATTLTVGEVAGATIIRVTSVTGFEVGYGVVIDLGGVNEEYHRISALTAGQVTIATVLVNAQGAGETIAVPHSRYGINIANTGCEGNLVINNDLYNDGFGTSPLNDAGTLTTISNNRGVQIAQEKDYAYVKNTSGGALEDGDVVVLKSVAAGNEITTTTTAGDQLVFGMVVEGISNNTFGYVQVKGKTVVLKVDGTTDIAIGDLIGTFTTAKIGMKAASGKMAFAVALEAYTTDNSNGVIDALIITPRQAV